MSFTIGLISDTHGLVRPSVHRVFEGVNLILHAGDVGGRISVDDILRELELIAPVEAVYGNCDPPGELRLASSIERTFEGLKIHVRHGHELGRPQPQLVADTYEADILVYGHTHIPVIERFANKLVINPGAAGPRRFDILPTVAKLTIKDGSSEAEIIQLD